MTTGLHAWIDESVHAQGRRDDFYILAASVSDRTVKSRLCSRLEALNTGPTRRLHWNSEKPRTRGQLTRVIAEADLDHLVVTAPIEARRQERARRKCLQRLLFELDQRGVTRAWIESRQAAQDRRDQEMVEAMRGAHGLSNALRIDFAKPLDDPMLWVPDAVAGMTLAALRDDNHTWFDQLNNSCTLISL